MSADAGAPAVVDGIPCWAPELATANEGFPAGRFERLYAAELSNFWYRSRARIVEREVKARLAPGATFIEIGCGTGSLLERLARGCGLRATGAEAYLDGLKLAKKRLPEAEFAQLDAAKLPYHARFDGAGLFDVLEHVDDDAAVLASVRDALKPGGFVFATAPQHPALWSANDDVAKHRRRYRRGELTGKLRKAGFEVIRETSFVTALLPVMAATRLVKRHPPKGDPYEAVLKELELPGWLNGALEAVMRVDEALIARGWSLPAGGSVLVVGVKPCLT